MFVMILFNNLTNPYFVFTPSFIIGVMSWSIIETCVTPRVLVTQAMTSLMVMSCFLSGITKQTVSRSLLTNQGIWSVTVDASPVEAGDGDCGSMLYRP